MTRIAKLTAVMLLALLLCGCSTVAPGNLAETTMVPGTDPVTPVAEAPEALRIDEEIALFFRYADQPYLAQEIRTVTQLPSQAWEQTIINALLSGPETHSTRLSPLFPEGTQLVSTTREGRTLFVTLSSEVMNAYPDEPAAWQQDAYWAQEVPRRRLLCMQSLAATITENSDVDRIQVFVAQSDVDGVSYRLPQSYFRLNDSATPAAMLTRDGSVLLTPDNTARAITDAWVKQDWAAQYQYVLTDDANLSQRSFTAAMEALPRLTGCTCSSGTISADGQSASYALTATIADGRTTHTQSGMLRLTRSGALWCVTLPQLTGWLEE